MKLLQRANRTYLLLTTALLLAAGCLLYLLMTTFIKDETNEKLLANTRRITKELEQGRSVAQLPPIIDVTELPASAGNSVVVKDTALFDPVEGEPESFREVTSIETINGRTYRIVVRQVIPEPHDYYNSIGLALALVFVLLLLGLFFINRHISRTLWGPFEQYLEVLRSFSLQEERPVVLLPSKVVELRELSVAIEKLTQRARSDYRSLKEFTENASHEMGTPLAVIQSKLEEALQSPNLSEELARQIDAAYTAVWRLAKLHQTLLLLTRIENRLFIGSESISPAAAIRKQLEYFDEFIRGKHLTVESRLDPNTVVESHPLLLETLLSNLIGNAVRHSVERGSIEITLQGGTLIIANSGIPLSVPTERLFERFAKGTPSSGSLGLGLAIVRMICESAGWSVAYVEREGTHVLTVEF